MTNHCHLEITYNIACIMKMEDLSTGVPSHKLKTFANTLGLCLVGDN